MRRITDGSDRLSVEEAVAFMEGDSNPFEKSAFLHRVKKEWRVSERKLSQYLGISKSQIHRILALNSVPENIREAVMKFNVDLWVCHRWISVNNYYKKILEERILAGTLTSHIEAVKLTPTVMSRRVLHVSGRSLLRKITRMEEELSRIKKLIDLGAQ
jgi:hypothetical protein